LILAVGIAGLVFLSACAAQGGLDVVALESELQQLTLVEYPGVVAGVECPDPLNPQPGDVVTCEVTIGAQVAPLLVTFGAERGGVSNARIDARLVDVASVEAMVAAAFAQDLGDVQGVQCAQPIIVVAHGNRITCSVTDGRGVERLVEVTPADDGTLAVALAG